MMIVHAHIALYHCQQDLRLVNCRELQDKGQSVELFGVVNFVKHALINIHTIREMHTKLSVNPKDINVEDFVMDERTILNGSKSKGVYGFEIK
jgi:hypothetical protein